MGAVDPSLVAASMPSGTGCAVRSKCTALTELPLHLRAKFKC